MALTKAFIQSSEAIGLFSIGRLEDAVTKWKDALSSIKQAVDSKEASSDQASPYTDATVNTADVLITKRTDFEGPNDDQHTVSIFTKAFAVADDSKEQDENLWAAMLLYNIGLAYSLQRHECSDASRVFRLYKLSLQILLDSGLMWHSSATLLVLALYNNIAHTAFCVHEIDHAIEALHELVLLLMDDSVRANHSSLEEDFEFFHRNIFVLASDMRITTSPAA